MLRILKHPTDVLRKCYSTFQEIYLSQKLGDRTLLQISGQDAKNYLQGLITNDMLHLQGATPSIYTLFLNSKGRILYDSIIYNAEKENVFLIECDKDASTALKNHLLMYKVRRKVNVDFVGNEFEIWNIIDFNHLKNPSHVCDYVKLKTLIKEKIKNIIVVKDPRLSCLGLRIITPKNFQLNNELEKLDLKSESKHFYKSLRFSLGVPEGLQELPSEKCFPMEANADFLNGISFQKGCYIGQELTARTYHTGVIRKRYMPIFLERDLELFEPGVSIMASQSKKSIGKLQGVENDMGIGLLRIEEALKAEELFVLETKCKTQLPFWWPAPDFEEKFKVK